ncbi:hypothetical protein GTS_12680 [Gandjariella thermophila]|uniref:Uncharacterized protein n=1 Tax=Gandjariella thermophila TaxID=1931992 RepID=A0A4D4IZ62_9PSEU|nr:hypothetical protein GTS_12680 [Gandjariella thermophila]
MAAFVTVTSDSVPAVAVTVIGVVGLIGCPPSGATATTTGGADGGTGVPGIAWPLHPATVSDKATTACRHQPRRRFPVRIAPPTRRYGPTMAAANVPI